MPPSTFMTCLVTCAAESLKRKVTTPATSPEVPIRQEEDYEGHLWLDHTPGDLLQFKTVTSVSALLAGAPLRPHVRLAPNDRLTEITDLNHWVCDLDTTIKDLVSPLAPLLLEITGISHTSAGVLIANIGDITHVPTSTLIHRRESVG